MPTKCMDQIPMPMAMEPPNSHQRAAFRVVVLIRPAISSAVYEARMATSNEIITNELS